MKSVNCPHDPGVFIHSGGVCRRRWRRQQRRTRMYSHTMQSIVAAFCTGLIEETASLGCQLPQADRANLEYLLEMARDS